MASIKKVDRPVRFKLADDGVRVTYFSNDKEYIVDISRHLLRRAIEEGRRMLDKADKEGARVLKLGDGPHT